MLTEVHMARGMYVLHLRYVQFVLSHGRSAGEYDDELAELRKNVKGQKRCGLADAAAEQSVGTEAAAADSHPQVLYVCTSDCV